MSEIRAISILEQLQRADQAEPESSNRIALEKFFYIFDAFLSLIKGVKNYFTKIINLFDIHHRVQAVYQRIFGNAEPIKIEDSIYIGNGIFMVKVASNMPRLYDAE